MVTDQVVHPHYLYNQLTVDNDTCRLLTFVTMVRCVGCHNDSLAEHIHKPDGNKEPNINKEIT